MRCTWVGRLQHCEKTGVSANTCCQEGNVLPYETSGAPVVLQKCKWPKRTKNPLKNKTYLDEYANLLMCKFIKLHGSDLSGRATKGWGPLVFRHDPDHLGIPLLSKNNQPAWKSNLISPLKQQPNNWVGGTNKEGHMHPSRVSSQRDILSNDQIGRWHKINPRVSLSSCVTCCTGALLLGFWINLQDYRLPFHHLMSLYLCIKHRVATT